MNLGEHEFEYEFESLNILHAMGDSDVKASCVIIVDDDDNAYYVKDIDSLKLFTADDEVTDIAKDHWLYRSCLEAIKWLYDEGKIDDAMLGSDEYLEEMKRRFDAQF